MVSLSLAEGRTLHVLNILRRVSARDLEERIEDAPVGILFAELCQQEGTETTACSTTETMEQLEALQQFGVFGFVSNLFQDWFDELGSFCQEALCKVVAGSRFGTDKVTGSIQVSQFRCPDLRPSAWRGERISNQLNNESRR